MGESDDLMGGTGESSQDDILVSDPVTAKVIALVADVLEVPKAEIGIETKAADLEAWDSFGHVRIVLAVDKAFGIELSMGAIEKADGIAGLVDAVEDALA